jgi:hypothetical protein
MIKGKLFFSPTPNIVYMQTLECSMSGSVWLHHIHTKGTTRGPEKGQPSFLSTEYQPGLEGLFE